MKIYEYYYLNDKNKECHYKGPLNLKLWNKLKDSFNPDHYDNYINSHKMKFIFHRKNGPAFIVYENNKIITSEWFLNGSFHREDGLCNNGLPYLRGKWLSNNYFSKITNHLICNLCYSFCNQICF